MFEVRYLVMSSMMFGAMYVVMPKYLSKKFEFAETSSKKFEFEMAGWKHLKHATEIPRVESLRLLRLSFVSNILPPIYCLRLRNGCGTVSNFGPLSGP